MSAQSQRAAAPAKERDLAAEARAIHNSAIVVDTHADTTQRFLDENFDIGTATPVSQGHVDLEKAKAGNLGAEFFSIWLRPTKDGHYAHRTLELIDSVYQQVARHPDRIVMAYSADDIVAARSGKRPRLAALMGIEGGHAIENSLGLLRDYYRLGVRYMTLTWANTNEWADSSGDIDKPDVPHHNGLTDFGFQVVREMNRLGMMVDISHVSDRTVYKTLVASRAPVIASHSAARALTNHSRNLTDDHLRAIARNGGVVMVNFYAGFIDENYRQAFEQMQPEAEKAMQELTESEQYKQADPAARYRMRDDESKRWAAKIPRPPLKSLIDQIDHVAKVAGIDHVGLGSDFDGIDALPEGIDSAADLPKITAALLERGYTRRDLHKLLGGNLLRVFRDVERVARQMQTEKIDPAAITPTQ